MKAQGDRHLADGALAEAETCYREALKARPNDADLCINLGLIAVRQGRLDTAEQFLRVATQADPQSADGFYLYGEVARMQHDLDAAAMHLRTALRLRPTFVEALTALAQLYSATGSHEQALSCYTQLHDITPDSPQWIGALADIQAFLGRHASALEAYDRLLLLTPDSAEAWTNRGTVLVALGREEEALESHAQAIRRNPRLFDAHFNRANVLSRCQRFDEAVQGFEQALLVRPDEADALLNLGNAQRRMGCYEDAIATYARAAMVRPMSADIYSNRGAAFGELNRHAEALQSYGAALAIDPDHAGAHFNRGLSCLLTGDLAGGWEGYEWRWKTAEHACRVRGFVQPQWDGCTSLDGKTILLHAEQGLGDTLQFCRYAAMVAARGAVVILEVQPSLVTLLSGLDGVTSVIAVGSDLPEFNLHCPLMSLPGVFGTRLETIPSAVPYIHPDAGRVADWAVRLGVPFKPRVGILWSGNSSHHNDLQRSISLTLFQQMLNNRVDVISLQKEVREGDRTALAANPAILDPAEALADFADTAALVAQLDLVICVDTSVAHLAGAMGKPVWLMLPSNPDWRWLLEGDTSPWYPTAKLFRQPRRGDWYSLMQTMKQELDRWCDAKDGAERGRASGLAPGLAPATS